MHRVTEPLLLAPLHVAGTTGQEGGGLLYHHPAHPDRPGADLTWEFSASAPRRFDPRTLPAGLVQVCRHTGHKKCIEELGAWVSAPARQLGHGGLRTLLAGADQASYEWGIVDGHPAQARLHMIDAGMHAADPSTYPLLPLGTGPWAEQARRLARVHAPAARSGGGIHTGVRRADRVGLRGPRNPPGCTDAVPLDADLSSRCGSLVIISK